MDKKWLIRKKYFLKRKKNYFNIDVNFFLPLVKLIKKIIKNKDINVAIYFPSSYEVNVLKILEVEYFKKDKYSRYSFKPIFSISLFCKKLFVDSVFL